MNGILKYSIVSMRIGKRGIAVEHTRTIWDAYRVSPIYFISRTLSFPILTRFGHHQLMWTSIASRGHCNLSNLPFQVSTFKSMPVFRVEIEPAHLRRGLSCQRQHWSEKAHSAVKSVLVSVISLSKNMQ